MITILEPSFDFILNKSKNLMLVILARPTHPHEPFMVFDKSKTLALFRDNNEVIKLTYIPRKILRILKRKPEITITEMTTLNKPLRQYTAKIVIDSRLKSKLKKEVKENF